MKLAYFSWLLFVFSEGSSAATAFPRDPTSYLSMINSGWPKALRPIEKQLHPKKNFLLISVLAPSFAFDLRSLEEFRASVLSTTKSRESVGHFMLGWQCRTGGKSLRGFAGQSGGKFSQLSKMFLGGWGYTGLVSAMNDGFLHGKDRFDEILENGNSKPPLYSILMEVSDSECQGLLGFLSQYLNHPSRPVYRYGPVLNPLKFEGANCLSFTGALLEKSGVFKKHYPLWWRSLDVPVSLLGRMKTLPPFALIPSWISRKPERSVSWADVLLWPYDRGGEAIRVSTLDPEMVLLTFRTLFESVLKKNLKDLDQEVWGELVRYIDAQGGSSPLVPKYSSEWQESHKEVNRRFDPQANRLFLVAKQWLRERKYGSSSITFLEESPLLILKR